MAKNIAEMLQIKNTTWAIKVHVDNEHKCTINDFKTTEDQQHNNTDNTIYITRSGVLQLVMKCRKSSVFKKWVMQSVLPCISTETGNDEDLSRIIESQDDNESTSLVPTTTTTTTNTNMPPPSTTVVLKKSTNTVNIINRNNVLIEDMLQTIDMLVQENSELKELMEKQCADIEYMYDKQDELYENLATNHNEIINAISDVAKRCAPAPIIHLNPLPPTNFTTDNLVSIPETNNDIYNFYNNQNNNNNNNIEIKYNPAVADYPVDNLLDFTTLDHSFGYSTIKDQQSVIKHLILVRETKTKFRVYCGKRKYVNVKKNRHYRNIIFTSQGIDPLVEWCEFLKQNKMHNVIISCNLRLYDFSKYDDETIEKIVTMLKAKQNKF
ncbi:BRO-A [Rachiplusia nu nucleopolyhedrovirus]|uniref:BRO-A n=1 Tax=Rachiplusia nu nucleopolyhedrovirus TaxID=2605775 RepID=A0AAF1DB48_9ABAC|nr:BRO-A [Rachiplusia nu nucleopolyhedrovirus]QEI03656.1 BRO-A [Rachiplusia nu nucleopolyhedrovirus]